MSHAKAKVKPALSPGAGAFSARLAAVRAVQQVWSGRSLDDSLDANGIDAPLVQWLAYGTLRWAGRLEGLLGLLLDKPLKASDSDLKALLLVALFELGHSHKPAYASVNESVALVQAFNKAWAGGLVNAVLRRYLREREALESQLAQMAPAIRDAHPAWLLQRLQSAYPEQWPAILQANNQQAPMTLRVNRRQGARADYLTQLQAAGIAAQAHPTVASAIVLETPVAVERLPAWATGAVSVQDAAAQLAAGLLDPQPGERVLDACAAPGGKAAHILEQADVTLWALDSVDARLDLLRDSLARLALPAAHLRSADAACSADWWDGQQFDRILLDAPCTATGVIRRHPDIKQLRRDSDVATLAAQQARLLDALWPLLKPGGRLLYATCSLLPEENSLQVQQFCARHADAQWRPDLGGQILPGEQGMDGFFYAVLDRAGERGRSVIT